MQLGQHFRFVVENLTTQTLAANACRVRTRRWRWGTDGQIVQESTEAEILNNGGTLANLAFFAGATQTNTGATPWVGGDFYWEVTAPAAVNGPVNLYYQESTDGGTTWPDNGRGRLVGTMMFTATGTQRDNPVL